jgi:Flp pilus assembly protein TadD
MYFALGKALQAQERWQEAADAYRKATTIKTDFPEAYFELGNALRAQGKLRDAVHAYRQAVDRKPDYAVAYFYLGLALKGQGKLSEAVDAYRKAIKHKPDFPEAYNNLGLALKGQGKLSEAVDAYREAIKRKPTFSEAYNNLGNVLYQQKKLAEAERALRKAIALKADYAEPHYNLGNVLRDQQKLGEAVAAFREAARLLPREPGIRTALQQAQRWLKLEKKFPALLDGKETPGNSLERLDLAEWCSRCKRLYRAAARFAADALAADPKLADDLQARHRYTAACAATLAAAGEGADATQLEETERARLRRQALGWLRADLALWSKQMKAGPRAQAMAGLVLRLWQQDPDLAGVRDPKLLAMLPPAERQHWRQFWKEVEALVGR